MRAVVVAGGDAAPGDVEQLTGADLVVAADSGAAWLDAHGRRPDLLVGDLDSTDARLVERLAAASTEVERHPSDKDASDAELALDRAVRAGADRIVIVGALAGPRFDHEIANLLLLADRHRAGSVADLRLVRGATLVRALHGPAAMEVEAAARSVVSLLPIGGSARGVRTSGLRFALLSDVLELGSSRGLSNVVEDPPASVSLEEGVLLVIETGRE